MGTPTTVAPGKGDRARSAAIIGQDGASWKALVELFYRQSYGVLFANFIVPLPTAWVLREAIPAPAILAWVATMYALTLGRLVLAWFYFRRGDGGAPLRWAWASTGLSWASSLLWGLLGWAAFLPADPHLLAFGFIVLTGLTCGAVPSLSAFPPAYVGTLIAMLTPVTIRCLQQADPMYQVYVVFIVCLSAVNLYYSRNTYRILRETVRLRSENLALITDLEGERDRAQAADRSKSRFLAAASHDLRQPIHALSLFAGALEAMGRKGDVASLEAVGLAKRFQAVIGNLGGILGALLDISKLDAGATPVAREPVRLARLLADLRDEYAGLARERGLEWRVVDSDLWVDSDPVLLRRVVGNLTANAFQHTSDGKVLVGVRRRGGIAEVQVLDTGPGIPVDQREQIFEEFVQLANPARDRRQGLGLGLAIVRRIASLLDHRVTMRSVEGRGSLFAIHLPVVASAEASLLLPEQTIQDEAWDIVVVDDDPDILTAASGLLEAWGHRSHIGQDPAAAIDAHARAAGGPVRLAIVDHRLAGGLTGDRAIEQLRARFGRALPAIIVTGDGAVSGGDGQRVLHKPLDPAELRRAIRQAVVN